MLGEMSRELCRAGLEFDVVPGPLMRATHGKALSFSHSAASLDI